MKIEMSAPCAACIYLRRKCMQECIFAPYFPSNQPQKFANVNKVFGACNVMKLLHSLDTSQRKNAVNSLAFEAEARLRDPVYGCVGLISVLQQRLKEMQNHLYNAKKELSHCIAFQAMFPAIQTPSTTNNNMAQSHLPNPPSSSSSSIQLNNRLPIMGGGPTGGPPLMIRDQHQNHVFQTQQLAAAFAVNCSMRT